LERSEGPSGAGLFQRQWKHHDVDQYREQDDRQSVGHTDVEEPVEEVVEEGEDRAEKRD
jgi:hypothetical protein